MTVNNTFGFLIDVNSEKKTKRKDVLNVLYSRKCNKNMVEYVQYVQLY